MKKSNKKEEKKNNKKIVIVIVLLLLLICILFPRLYKNYQKIKFIKEVENSVLLYKKYNSSNKSDMSKTTINNKKIFKKKNKLIDGLLMSVDDEEISIHYVSDGNYCASGTLDNLIITEGPCKVTEESKTIISSYLFSIDSNGGKFNNSSELKNINIVNDKEFLLDIPTNGSELFTGWNIKVTSNIYDETNGFLNLNYKAIWNNKNNTINKDSNVSNIEDLYKNEKNIIKVIKLVINPNLGSWNNSKDISTIVLKNNDYLKLLNPVRDGYLFTGWKTISSYDGGNELITKLEATYKKDYKKVVIDLNGGNSSQKLEHKLIKGESLILEEPKKDGFVFYEWDVNGKKTSSNKIVMDDNDITVKAIWVDPYYNLSVDLDGGIIDNDFPDMLAPKESYKLSVPIKIGYQFLGWDVKGKNSSVKNNNFVMGVEDSSIKAKWKIRDYSIEYVLDNGNVDNAKTYNIKTETFTLNNPTKEHYSFVGWTSDEILKPMLNVVITKGMVGNRKYIANYVPIDYEIQYNLNGGILNTESLLSYNIEKEIILEEPYKAGYTFKGWYETEDFSGKVVNKIEKGNTGVKTYYAKWEVNNYSIKYNLNGGVADNVSSYTIETETFTLNNPIKENYNFIGWSSNDINTPILDLSIEKGSVGNKEFTANYEPTKYKIVYNYNDGNKIETVDYTIEDEIVLLMPSRKGYEFAGWYETEDFSTDVITKLEKGNFGEKKYYAKWEIVTYNIAYVLNGGNELDSPVLTYTIEDQFDLEFPVREGYDFKGWFTTNNLDGESYNQIAKGTSGNKVYYAKWEKYKEYNNTNIYEIIKDGAVADNIPSLFVGGEKGIDFSKTSTISNGFGKYILSNNDNSNIPVYYYRGDIMNNNVIFANHCWLIVRSTETKGVRLIYNGPVSDGKCNNTGASTTVASSKFDGYSLTSGSYMYSQSVPITALNILSSNFKLDTVFAKDISFDEETNTYKLLDTYKFETFDKKTALGIIEQYPYTCLSSSTSCAKVNYVYYTRVNGDGSKDQSIYYFTISGGVYLDEFLDNKLMNPSSRTVDSLAKKAADTWYENNLIDYKYYIDEDSIYCGENQLLKSTGMYGGDKKSPSWFISHNRTMVNFAPSTYCSESSSYTSSKLVGNGYLKYPIALLNVDELQLSGFAWQSASNTYLTSSVIYWTMSSGMISARSNYVFIGYGSLDSLDSSFAGLKTYVRPAITLKYGTVVSSGNGTANNPFVVEDK